MLPTGAINFKATDILPALGLEHVLAKLTVRIIIIFIAIIIIILIVMVTMIMIIKMMLMLGHQEIER